MTRIWSTPVYFHWGKILSQTHAWSLQVRFLGIAEDRFLISVGNPLLGESVGKIFLFFGGSLSKTMLSGDHFSSARRYHPDYDPVTGALSDTCLPRADQLGVARAQTDRGLDHDPDWMRQEAERQDPGWMMLDDWVCYVHFLLVSEWAFFF